MISEEPSLQKRPLLSVEEACRLFLHHLPLIERIIGFVCREHGLRGADAEDFASSARLKLIENDYGALRRYRGCSSLPTYLTIVIQNVHLDQVVHEKGRWRPSTTASRMGEPAVLLERLLYRDRRTQNEATAIVRDRYPEVAPKELETIQKRLRPRSERPTIETSSEIPEVPNNETAEKRLLDEEREVTGRRATAILKRTLSQLSPRERLIMKFHFIDALKVSTIARCLQTAQMPLYREVDRLLKRLRQALNDGGIGRHEARDLIAHGSNALDDAVEELMAESAPAYASSYEDEVSDGRRYE